MTSRVPDPEPIVFVVDDDASVREALGRLIRSAGMRVEAFASAEAFLERGRADVPSCLVLDVQLPDLSGLDLQRRMVETATISGCPSSRARRHSTTVRR